MMCSMPEVDVLVANTRRSLVRLRAVSGRLDEQALVQVTISGWTIAGTLAHLAFFDDWVAERWRRRLASGAFQDLPDDITDLVNAAGARAWQATAPDQATAIATGAAEAVVSLLETLSRAALDDAIATRRSAMIDRSLHWEPHLDQIEDALR